MTQKEIQIGKHLTIRLNDDGTLDEIISRDVNGEVNFHLEQMSDLNWWMRFYGTKTQPLEHEVIAWIGPEGGKYELEDVES